MMNQEYWQTRRNWYQEMASHIKEQRNLASADEKQKLVKELERIYNEIAFINDNHLAG